jgi:hypothetical protein
MYGKIFERAFTGSMYGSGPVVFSVWAYVIAHAKPPGVVELNPKLLASCIGTSHNEVADAIAFLCRTDFESQNKDEDGRRLVKLGGLEYRVVSFDKYRQMQSTEDRRAYHREYWHKRKTQQHSTELNKPQQNSSHSTEAEAEAEAEAKKKRVEARASRFALDSLPSEWESFVTTTRPDLDPKVTFDRFRDYWTAQPGQRGRKVDWQATWRNWCRNEKLDTRKKPADVVAEVNRLLDSREAA